MRNYAINLQNVTVLIADQNPYMRRVINSMLRGFGANKVLEVGDSFSLLKTLSQRKIEVLLCDSRLRPLDGITLTRTIRRNSHNENRTIPILLMCSDTAESTIKNARDAGANMVIAKPMSPNNLYERLGWIAFNPRQFVDTANYFGPDRRFKIEGYPGGVGRRKGDHVTVMAQEVGPTLAQDDIDNLFNSSRVGGSSDVG
jgi:CheY-like chemotaxis protein